MEFGLKTDHKHAYKLYMKLCLHVNMSTVQSFEILYNKFNFVASVV